MHPFGKGGACAAGLFRTPLLEPLIAKYELHDLIRSRGARISEVLMEKLGAKIGYRLIFDDLVLKSVLVAQIKSDDGAAWKEFGIALQKEGLKLGADFAKTSPFPKSPCHENAGKLPDGDDDPFAYLRKMMWSATGAVEADFDRMTRLAQAYDLTLNQLDAVGWYSSPQAGWRGGEVPRTDEDAAGQASVVKALRRAIRHLPSMRDLGLQTVTFRVVGGDAPSVERLKVGNYILHGVRKMKNGSHHFMSTSITPNVKGFAVNLKKAGEVLAICGTSGRYIQWLGRHSGAMDGEEVLYPPGTVTMFYGEIAKLTVGKRTDVPLYLLMECGPPPEKANVVDDFKFGSLTGAEDLTEIRKRYATTGRAIGEEDVSQY